MLFPIPSFRSPLPQTLLTAFALGAMFFGNASRSRAGSAIESPTVFDPQVGVTLVVDAAAAMPGSTLRVGVRFDMSEGWHINWINPGDAGLAPGIAWTLPGGLAAGEIIWPGPERHPAGPLTIFGYDETVTLWTEIRVADTVAAQPLTIVAEVDWLACSDSCVPGQATLRLSVPVTHENPSSKAGDARTRIPGTPGYDTAWRFSGWYQDDETIVVEIDPAPGAPTLGSVFLFPYEQGVIDNAATQELSSLETSAGQSGYRLEIRRDPLVNASPLEVRVVAVADPGFAEGLTALETTIRMNPSPR